MRDRGCEDGADMSVTGTQCLVECRLCQGLLCTDCAKVHLTFIEEGIYSLIHFLPDNSMKHMCGFYCQYLYKTLPFSVMSTNDFLAEAAACDAQSSCYLLSACR